MSSKWRPGAIERPKRLRRVLDHARAADQDREARALVDHHLGGAQDTARPRPRRRSRGLRAGLARAVKTGFMMKPERNTNWVSRSRVGVRSSIGRARRRSPSPATATAGAMRRIRRGSNGFGISTCGRTRAPRRRRRGARPRRASRGRAPRSRVTAASFMASLMVVAPTSSAPRKMYGKHEDVVDLVRIVAAPGADHRVGPRGVGLLGQDLGIGIGERQDDRARRHSRPSRA